MTYEPRSASACSLLLIVPAPVVSAQVIALLTWAKPSIGLSTWSRYQTEHLIHARRGSLRTWPGCSNLFEARRSRHSAKPNEAYELIERASAGPYLDLFARRQCAGWTVWGDEVS